MIIDYDSCTNMYLYETQPNKFKNKPVGKTECAKNFCGLSYFHGIDIFGTL